MPKKKASKTVKRKVSHSHHTDDHSFLIIAGGGFVIISIIMIFMYNQPSGSSKMMYETTNATTDENEAQTVTIKDSMFVPEALTVKVGQTVTWKNADAVEHNIVSDDDVFTTGVLASGEEGTYTFTKAGTYAYHCSIHPEMTGSIVVE